MKKIIIILAFNLICLANLKAQTSYSCNYREYCRWNDTTEKFVDCSGYDEPSLFVMNKAETMFTHTIESMKSTYYIDKKEYDKDKDIWTYNVTSDVGNKYYYIFDAKNKEIKAVFVRDGVTKLLRFYVKAIF